MNDDEAKEQSEQQKKGVVGRVNQTARQVRGAYNAAQTVRRPISSLRGRFSRKKQTESEANDATQKEKEEKKRSIADYSNTARNILRTINTARTVVTFIINPGTAWALVGVIVVILIVVILQGNMSSIPNPFGDNNNDNSGQPGGGEQNNFLPIPGLTIGLEGPPEVGSGASITYSISLSYDQSIGKIPPEAITVFDILPANTTLESATPPYILNGDTVEWKLSDVLTLSPFKITLKPTKDVFISNTISARATVDSASGPPSADNCNGTYNLTLLPDKLNFGDPKCTFTKDQLYALLQQDDPTNADLWYKIIIPCESGYNPNAYNPNSSSTLGAFGLFQMNPKGQGSTQFDAGNVEWLQQVPNAIAHNKIHSNDFGYWECAP